MMNAQRLSPLNQHLVTELRSDAALAAERFDLRHESVPPFLYGYPYEVSAWPIFVNGRFIREQIEPLLDPMPRILYQSLRARFSDSTAMAEYFGWPELICEMFEQAPVDPRDLLIRYDAVLDDSGLKLIENNFGSSAGGWQSDYFQPQMRTRLSRLEQSQAKNFRYRFILPAMLKTLAAGICRRKPAGAAGNLLVYHTFSPGGPNLANFHDSLQSVYDAVKPPAIAGGRVTILRNFDDIGFTAAGEVIVDGKIMDAFIMGDALYTDIPQAMLNRLIAAHLRDQLVFPDSPFHLLLGDKGVLALMHECVSARLLDPADCALIKRYVPWTARLLDQEVLLEGVHVPLVQHLLAHKERAATAQLRRSETASRERTCSTHARLREGPNIFPRGLPSGSACPASAPRSPSSGAGSPAQDPSVVAPDRPLVRRTAAAIDSNSAPRSQDRDRSCRSSRPGSAVPRLPAASRSPAQACSPSVPFLAPSKLKIAETLTLRPVSIQGSRP